MKLISIALLLGLGFGAFANDDERDRNVYDCYWGSHEYSRERVVEEDGDTIVAEETLGTRLGDIAISAYLSNKKTYRDEYWSTYCENRYGDRYDSEIEVRYTRLISNRATENVYSKGVRFFQQEKLYKRTKPEFEKQKVEILEDGSLVQDGIFGKQPLNLAETVLVTVKGQISDVEYRRLEELLNEPD